MLSLYKERLFLFKLLLIQQVLSLPSQNDLRSLYDQRQTGKYNIHISLKDVAIIKIDKNEFVDDTLNNSEEYYYDEDDLTIKPISTWPISTPPLTNHSTKEPITSFVTSKPDNNTVLQEQIQATTIDAMNTSTILYNNSSLESANSPIISDTVMPMVIKPVLNKDKIKEDNIAKLHNAQRSRQHTIHDTQFGSNIHKNKIDTKSVLNIISTRPLLHRQINICRSDYIIDSNGNCRKKRRPSILTSLFGIFKLL